MAQRTVSTATWPATGEVHSTTYMQTATPYFVRQAGPFAWLHLTAAGSRHQATERNQENSIRGWRPWRWSDTWRWTVQGPATVDSSRSCSRCGLDALGHCLRKVSPRYAGTAVSSVDTCLISHSATHVTTVMLFDGHEGPSAGMAGRGDPPIVLGDGMNLWDQLSGSKPWSASPRTELL